MEPETTALCVLCCCWHSLTAQGPPHPGCWHSASHAGAGWGPVASGMAWLPGFEPSLPLLAQAGGFSSLGLGILAWTSELFSQGWRAARIEQDHAWPALRTCWIGGGRYLFNVLIVDKAASRGIWNSSDVTFRGTKNGPFSSAHVAPLLQRGCPLCSSPCSLRAEGS